jgi:hypothetical protein
MVEVAEGAVMLQRWILPWVSFLLLVAMVGSVLTAFGTGDWRWLTVTALCFFIISSKG